MKIAIVNFKSLNNCWSALQYTDNCHLCHKVMTCKIKSLFHKKGIEIYSSNELDKLNSEYKIRIDNLKNDTIKALNNL